MVVLSGHSVSSMESRKSLKWKWKRITKLTTRTFKRPSSKKKTLSFSDDDFLDGDPNEFIPFVISASILELDVKRIVINQRNSADIMFQDLLPKLSLSISNLSPYRGGDLSGLKPSQAGPIGYLEVLVTYGLRKLSWTANTTFVGLPLVTTYHCIVGRLTLAKLGVVPSPVHLKMKLHALAGKVVTISADINFVERSQYLALNGTRCHLQDAFKPPMVSGYVLLTEVNAQYDSDSSEDKDDDQLARELKKKNKRPELEGEFIEVPLKNDPTKIVKLGANLSKEVWESLIACLWQNADLFAWFESEMPGIPLEVACHHLAVNRDAKCVAQRRRV